MSAGLKTVTVLLGATGAVGCIVASTTGKTEVATLTTPETLSQANPVAVDSDQSQAQTERSPQTQLTNIAKAGKCTAFEPSDESIFEDLGIVDIDEYTVVYCTNTDEEDSDWSQWTGFLPNGLFGLYYKLDSGTSFELKTITESIDQTENNYRATFTSDQFENSPVVGEWGSTFTTSSDKEVTSVTLVSEKHQGEDKIYLLFDQTID